MSVTLHKKTFQELSTDELYELLRVRSEVFVVEQNCVYQDLDYDDQKSIHLWLTDEDKVVALARVCPAGTHMKEIPIRRVIPTERGKGYGKQIMLNAIDTALEHFDAKLIDIVAQEYAKGFYEGVGFKQSSETFMLDGIPHIKMTWSTQPECSRSQVRIFIAIRFNDEFKEKLVEIQDSLKSRGVTGNYCSYGNLHMTLAFIGENYDLPAIRKAVSEIEFEPFEMTLGHLGTFPTKAGVIWCGVKDGTSATSLANQLRERLKANGVSFNTLAFFPHISLVQHPSAIITDIEVPDATIQVEQIHVMKSERIEGELIYSEI